MIGWARVAKMASVFMFLSKIWSAEESRCVYTYTCTNKHIILDRNETKQCSLALFPGRRRNSLATYASSNCYFRCLKVGSTNQISERSHITKAKPNCICIELLHSRPFHFNRLLNRASVGASHDDLRSNNFYFTSVVERTANSCFYEQESTILTAGKL